MTLFRLFARVTLLALTGVSIPLVGDWDGL